MPGAADAEAALAERLDGSHYRDDVLRLLFMCCHPDLPATQQIALALRIVSGLSVRQIARAFLVGEAAMEQRITRAKAPVAGANLPFETPGAVEHAGGGRAYPPPPRPADAHERRGAGLRFFRVGCRPAAPGCVLVGNQPKGDRRCPPSPKRSRPPPPQ